MYLEETFKCFQKTYFFNDNNVNCKRRQSILLIFKEKSPENDENEKSKWKNTPELFFCLIFYLIYREQILLELLISIFIKNVKNRIYQFLVYLLSYE